MPTSFSYWSFGRSSSHHRAELPQLCNVSEPQVHSDQPTRALRRELSDISLARAASEAVRSLRLSSPGLSAKHHTITKQLVFAVWPVGQRLGIASPFGSGAFLTGCHVGVKLPGMRHFWSQVRCFHSVTAVSVSLRAIADLLCTACPPRAFHQRVCPLQPCTARLTDRLWALSTMKAHRASRLGRWV